MEPTATKPEESGGLVDELMRAQFDLYAHIVALMGGTDDAYDVLQETNQQILRQADRRDDVVHFLAWAKRLAYFQVLTWRKRRSRDRLVFDDALFEQIADALPEATSPMSARIHALNECVKKLPAKMRELFLSRHVDGVSVQKLAEAENRSPEGVSVTLHRTRVILRECIEKRLAAERLTHG